MAKTDKRADKQYRYPWPVIEKAIHLYLEEDTTYRSVASKMTDHGVWVSHKTIYEWVQKFWERVDQGKKKSSSTYDIKEDYVKCNGEWKYMYRAHDRQGSTLDVVLRDRKNMTMARSFFQKNLKK